MTEIKRCAYEDCTSLTSFSVPRRCKRIGYRAFNRCTSLERLFVSLENLDDEDPTGIAAMAFRECPLLTHMELRGNAFLLRRTRSRDVVRRYWNMMKAFHHDAKGYGGAAQLRYIAIPRPYAAPAVINILIPPSSSDDVEEMLIKCGNEERTVARALWTVAWILTRKFVPRTRVLRFWFRGRRGFPIRIVDC